MLSVHKSVTHILYIMFYRNRTKIYIKYFKITTRFVYHNTGSIMKTRTHFFSNIHICISYHIYKIILIKILTFFLNNIYDIYSFLYNYTYIINIYINMVMCVFFVFFFLLLCICLSLIAHFFIYIFTCFYLCDGFLPLYALPLNLLDISKNLDGGKAAPAFGCIAAGAACCP